MIKKAIFLLTLSLSKTLCCDEIIKDRHGNFFLMKEDGTFKKLPPPKPGNKYVIEKKIIKKGEKRENILKKRTKKARTRTNQGFK